MSSVMASTAHRKEQQLMARYAEGDDVAFRQLFAVLAPKVRAFFLRSFIDPSVADDLTQTTFLKLHRARATYSADRPLDPWVFTIAASVRRDELRRRYRLPPHVSDVELEKLVSRQVRDRNPSPPETDEIEAVRAAIQRLPESQRTVLHLHCTEELTFDQIAERLQTSPCAVRVRASRAYERLRKALGRVARRTSAS
jgi:RNA polymerase sigma-70 factor, ECF subfamily